MAQSGARQPVGIQAELHPLKLTQAEHTLVLQTLAAMGAHYEAAIGGTAASEPNWLTVVDLVALTGERIYANSAIEVSGLGVRRRVLETSSVSPRR